jgi:hypothetical protein
MLVARMNLGRLLEILQGITELATVVEEHPIVEEVFEALGTELGPLDLGPLAHRAVGSGPLYELALLSVLVDQRLEEVASPIEVLLAQRLDSLLEEFEGGAGTPIR